jgi:hypothetical protein
MAIIVACAVAIGIVRLLQELAHQVTMPAGLDPTNMDQVKVALERGEFPFASLALVLCGWLLAAYVGGRIASRIGRARITALGFTIIFTAFIIHELTLLPHPTWMWIGGALAVPLVALGAAGESITLRGL